MCQKPANADRRFVCSSVLILCLCWLAACAPLTPSANTTVASRQVNTAAVVNQGLLPGQQIWKQGVSSFLFGTNDTQEWAKNNVETNLTIQLALSKAHFTLMRTFFFDKSLADGHATTDAEIEQRLATIENSGMICLGVLHSIFNPAFVQHVVKYAGNRCNIYEFGNEDDYNGVSISAYLQQWNSLIPVLRKLNPAARFIGPVTYNDQGNHDFMRNFLEGVKSSNVLPDAISFHYYPCYQDTRESCLAKAGSYGPVTQGVRALVRSILGRDLPIGITEWNYDPGNPPPTYGNDPQFITQFSTDALHAMIQAGVAFACQFAAGSYSGYGLLDMFNLDTSQPKPQFTALKNLIAQYRPATISSPNLTANPSTSIYGPLVSRGKPVVCQGNDVSAGGTGAIVDGHFGNWGFWRSSLSSLPAWCAIHVGVGPTRLLLNWYSDYSFDYYSDQGLGPQNYSISVSPDSTNGQNGNWQTIATIVDNHTRVREHLIPFTGQSWVKMTVTKAQTHASQPFMTIDEIELHDVSATGLNDTYFFSGDSISAMAFSRFDGQQPAFAELVHAASKQRFPLMIDGGVGGWNSDGAAQNIGTWLSLNPDVHYWLLEWGTNDALEQVSPDHFKANLQIVVSAIQQAGRVPIIAHLPYISGRPASVDQEVQALNGVIDAITKTNSLATGPDFYTLFKTHAGTYLLSDGIHPSPSAAIAMNKAWFQVLQSSPNQ